MTSQTDFKPNNFSEREKTLDLKSSWDKWASVVSTTDQAADSRAGSSSWCKSNSDDMTTSPVHSALSWPQTDDAATHTQTANTDDRMERGIHGGLA